MPEPTSQILLIQCPAWVIDAPPHGLSIIAAGLKEKNFRVTCFDMNIGLYHEAIKAPKGLLNPGLWLSENLEHVWNNRENAASLFQIATPLIDEIIDFLRQNTVLSIGFTVHYTSLHFTYLLVKKIKLEFPSISVIWGGPYCFGEFGNLKTIVQKMPEVDVVCTGDGDRSFPVLMEYFKNTSDFCNLPGYYIRSLHAWKYCAIGDASGNLSDVPFAAFDAFDTNSYSFKFLPVWVSNGCVNRCAFCYECKIQKKYSFREPEKIVEEIVFQQKQFQQIEYFWLTCSNIGGDIEQLTKMCSLLHDKALGIKWISQIAIHPKLTPELIQLMKYSGCAQMYFGIESGSTRVLNLMNKRFSSSLAKKQLSEFAYAGIEIDFNIVVGFPGETNYDFIKTLFFIKRFLKYNISPSVATCKISEGSRLHRFSEKYEVVNPNSENWSTKDGKNNLMIRNLRKKYTDKLYGFRLINLFRLSLKFNQYTLYVREKFPENKSKRLKGRLAYIASELVDFAAYPLFLPWIGLIAVHLKLIETIQVFKVKA
ncbi:MAG TPA: radical SAM protein [Bacteroidales bacterium]|nr:radical SAM protein [Bacteroidales bacterium]